jgi:predicted glycoside hydrolase/deacetylase ChbG (UPF0249 family)
MMATETRETHCMQSTTEIAVAELPDRYPSALIINADDWGRDTETTNRILDCLTIGTVSSTSAMVYMEDSKRAADIARERTVDCGLHLNFTSSFSGSETPLRVREHQERITRYLRRNKFARTVFHPGLVSSFEYVISAQIEEFAKLFGKTPARFDGHHHMHLCANVLFSRLMPTGAIVRRNFSFRPSEKGSLNRLYRQAIDRFLAKKYQITDYFFSLPPLEPSSRVDEILSIARRSIVELETHPVNPLEYKFLTTDLLQRREDLSISRAYLLRRNDAALAW